MKALTMDIIGLGLGQVGIAFLVLVLGFGILDLLLWLIFGKILRTRNSLIVLLIAPAFVGLALLVIFPIIYEVRLAFSNMSLRHFKDPSFSLAQAWTNFSEIFNSPILQQARFLPVFLRTILWTFAQVSCHVVFGLFLATLLNKPIRLRNLYRTLLVIPWAIPQVIACLTWRSEFHYEYGFINIMLRTIGLPAIQWKSDAMWNFVAMNITNIWLGVPFMMVICLGGLKGISREYYEAAEIDGASGWIKFRRVTLPLLQPVLTPAIILGVIWTFNNFNVPYFINENRLETSDILVTALFRSAFEYNRYGFSAAFAIVIFVILFHFSVFYIRSTGALKGVRG